MMSAATVDAIIRQIEQLPEEDRLLLEKRLAEMTEAEWRTEAERARQTAREKGVDQAAIDRAIEKLRYPQ
jgi:hypothetical protein